MTAHCYLLNTIFAASFIYASLTATAAGQNITQQPIGTNFAQTQTEIGLDLTASRFSDVELDEADNFDGHCAAIELTVPFDVNKQFRLSVPFYTKGNAHLKSDGQPIHIDGNGGVFDYLTLQYEHQHYVADERGYNLAYTLGAGIRTTRLDTTTGDYYNHTGKIILLGMKMDKDINGGETQLLVNAGIRYYSDADDLHPRGLSSWAWADVKSAVVFKPWSRYLQPVVELTYLGGFNDYNAVSLMPELIIQIAEAVSLKAGGILGITSDGNQGGVTGEFSIAF